MIANDLVIREMTVDDISFVAQMEQKNFTTPWKESSLRDTLKQRTTIFYLAKYQDTPVGYISRTLSFETADILTVCVEERYRKHGVATKLLQYLEDDLKSLGAQRIFLEVRESNRAARTLYEKNGYVFLNKRVRYYSDPIEDALVMQKEIMK